MARLSCHVGSIALHHFFQSIVGSLRLSACEAPAEHQQEAELSTLSPTSPLFIFRPHDDLEVAFDTRTRNPIYVMERLRPSTTRTPRRRRRHRFYEESALPDMLKSRNSHYRGSGYDRGHMAPSADFEDSHGIDTAKSTFSLCNVSPQVPSFNRSVWARLERWTRSVANSHQDYQTIVVTGPLWLPKKISESSDYRYQHRALISESTTPPTLLSVPTHFYKLVIVMKASQQHPKYLILKHAAFVVPNKDVGKGEKPALEQYLVRWTDLESVVGLHFFPTVATEEWKRRHADRVSEDVMWNIQRSGQRLLHSFTDDELSLAPEPKFHLAQRQRTEHYHTHLCSSGTCSYFRTELP